MPNKAEKPHELHQQSDPGVLPEVSDEDIARLRERILDQLKSLRLPSWAGGDDPAALSKDSIRSMHAAQRRDILERELATLGRKAPELLMHFADGREVCPEAIDPELVPIKSESPAAQLFRFATLLWSVPVSRGYGRRMRYLVRDRSNGKLIGIFGLTDPVFNLRARDQWIGWDVEQRRAGLVHVMDAYVVGAVPPYSYLLGGKLVASLIGSAEVGEAFARRYGQMPGHISKQRKGARLVLVTVTSALGRSSLYNRLRLLSRPSQAGHRRVLVELIRVGSTEGYGHFHLSESLFHALRLAVKAKGHQYADAYQYGDGPNWRIRVARVGLAMLGLDPDLLRHGIGREVYVMPLAGNCCDFLCGRVPEARLDRARAREIAEVALERWVLPRAARYPDYATFERGEILSQLHAAIQGERYVSPGQRVLSGLGDGLQRYPREPES